MERRDGPLPPLLHMPSSSSSSSVHHAPYGLRRSSRLSANSASSLAGEHPGKAAKESRRGHSVDSMGPQEDPAAKKVPKGPAPKRKRVVVMISYRECRKNHAASIGGYAVDGCREFMASGEEGTNAALMCAACSCHRSFHKREVKNKVTCDCDFPSDSASSWTR